VESYEAELRAPFDKMLDRLFDTKAMIAALELRTVDDIFEHFKEPPRKTWCQSYQTFFSSLTKRQIKPVFSVKSYRPGLFSSKVRAYPYGVPFRCPY
jgi:hypothetical protein